MRWVKVSVAVTALALAAAGCGGSSSDNSSAAADATTSEATTSEATTTESTETSTETEAATTGESGLTGACAELATLGQKYGEAVAAAGSGGNADLQETAKAFAEFAKQVPDELKDDFEALAGVVDVYAEVLADIDVAAGETPSPDQLAKLAQAAQSLNTEDLTRATANIEAWVQENCGVNP
jgi:hypothetical protein